MIVVAIIGIFISVGPQLLQNIFRLWKTNEARVDVQRSARTCLTLVQNLLRHASANSIEISRFSTDDPPYSQITFTDQDNHTYTFYQNGNELWINHVDPNSITHTRPLAENLRFISFGFPQVTEDNLLSVAICFEKTTYGSATKDFYLSTQRVRVMNI